GNLIAAVPREREGQIGGLGEGKVGAGRGVAPRPEGIRHPNYGGGVVMSMASRTDAEIVTYGLTSRADLWAEDIQGLGLDGIRFWLCGGDRFGNQRYAVKLPMLGRHSVQTALRAAAVGLVEGLHWEEVIRGLQDNARQLRLIAVAGPNGSVILDDTYNASPPSTIAALNLLNDLVDGRRIAVLGDMLELGSYERQGHHDVGIRAAQVADLLVTVGERGKLIAEAARRHRRRRRPQISVFDSAEEAADFLLREVR